MPQTLKYTVVNAQLVKLEQPIEIDGAPATATFVRTVIEAAPDDTSGKTFSAVLPNDALAEFPEGATITITIAADAAQTEA